MLETLKTLCYLNGVSGFEDEVRNYILQRALPYAESVSTDPLGNLYIFKKGKTEASQKIMVCAHMDEVGFIVMGITDEGYLRFGCVGGIDRRILIGKKVFVGENRIPGVIAVKAIHQTTAEEQGKVPAVDELYIDIGCPDKESAEKLTFLGDFCSFDNNIVEFGNGWLKAKAIDDRVGCAAALKLIESDLPCDVTFVFSVQEEIGARGAGVAANRICPDISLVLEGTTATDLPGIADSKRICIAGKGIVVPFMDGGTVYDKAMYSAITSIADEIGVKWQTKTRIAGGTDGYSIQRSRAGVHTAAISCAVRNIHSPACVLKISEFEDMYKLSYSFLEKVAEGKLVF